MKKVILSVLCLATAAPVFADASAQFANDKARNSYAIGISIGRNFKQGGVDLDTDMFLRGLEDVQKGGPLLLTDDQLREVLTAYQKDLRAKQQQMVQQMGVKNKADGDAFLAANLKNAGVVALPDGLQYQILTAGAGPVPTGNDKVTVNYSGTLLDGTEFDSSYKRGQPASFPVHGVIPGWTEALQKMPVGSKWKLFIPSNLAYGPSGTRGIPPNSTLIFQVELLSIDTPPTPVATPTAAPLTSDIIKVPSAEEMKNGAKIEVIKPEDAQKMQSQTNQ